MTYQLTEGQKIFTGVLVSFDEVKGNTKKDNKPFHFLKFGIDFTLKRQDGSEYSRIVEFTADPQKYVGRRFQKYLPVSVILEIFDPVHNPSLVDVIQQN